MSCLSLNNGATKPLESVDQNNDLTMLFYHVGGSIVHHWVNLPTMRTWPSVASGNFKITVSFFSSNSLQASLNARTVCPK
mmetsp:Transcript_22521/g.38609  ORF Transcript_22521/g.38609 Transcript_22521/m.38609 type:complete len:80 (-) Transcript_22521:275-514(-)